MDDAAVFGPTIAELKLRALIQLGVLPDYHIWTLRGDGAGLAAKAECVLRAWSSTELVKTETGRKEQPILNHLILYARTGEEAKELADFFRAFTTVVLLLSGDDAEEKVAEFQRAPRAILVNCKMLNEGVDIPMADSVAIMYPKQAHWEIVQMLLRAGRWHPTKAVFHLLLPLLEGDDLAAYQEVLLGLAACDEQVREEILALEASGSGGSGQGRGAARTEATTTCIIDHFGSTTDDVLQCFKAVRKALSLPGMLRDVQGWCAENRVDSSEAYRRHREDFPELPEDPVPWTQTWFDWLHPGAAKLPLTEFERVLEAAGLQSARAYACWREGQESPAAYPAVQHVNDGYFGGQTNFTTLFKAPRTRG
jgi:superfamily II DNA or RNA helicase